MLIPARTGVGVIQHTSHELGHRRAGDQSRRTISEVSEIPDTTPSSYKAVMAS